MAYVKKKPSRISALLLAALQTAIREYGGLPKHAGLPEGTVAVRESHWRDVFYRENGGKVDTNRKRFARRWSLLDTGPVVFSEGWYWIQEQSEYRARMEDSRGVPKFVYVVACLGGARLSKIGIASSPERRLKQFSTSSPHTLRLEFARFVPDALALERMAHEHFAASRKNGEWFDIPAKAAITYLNEMADAA